MLSPPLLGYQPNFFVKRSLNSDCFLFFLCVKSSLNKPLPRHVFQHLYFFFCVKHSLNRKRFICHQQQPDCPDPSRTSLFTNIFSRREIYSLFDVLLCVLWRCIVIYNHCLLYSTFYFTVKITLLSMLNSQSFFFWRENCSLFLIVFLDKLCFYDVATLLFYAQQFSFSSWKPLSVPCCFLLIYAFLRSLQFSFLFAWNFLAISKA